MPTCTSHLASQRRAATLLATCASALSIEGGDVPGSGSAGVRPLVSDTGKAAARETFVSPLGGNSTLAEFGQRVATSD